jgi:hypothetical protein
MNRLKYHSIFSNAQFGASGTLIAENPRKFRNSVIRKVIKLDLYEHLNHPFTRKFVKIYAFNIIIGKAVVSSFIRNRRTGNIMIRWDKWKIIDILRINKIVLEQMSQRSTSSFFFGINWKHEARIIEFHHVNSIYIYFDLLYYNLLISQ